MGKVNIPIVNNSINPLPAYAKPGDAGMDLMADFSQGIQDKFLYGARFYQEEKKLYIPPMARVLIPTNLYTAIPMGYEIQIRPRSGSAIKEGITVLNTPGTIDSGYRNSWGVILINLSDQVVVVQHGDRIAQAVLNKVEEISWEVVDELPESERGLGGFGHTGK